MDAKTLRFSVDGRATFGFSLSDISGGSSAKDDVMLELHTDDTAAGDKEDVLTEIAFYVPPGNTDFPADGEPTDEDYALMWLEDHAVLLLRCYPAQRPVIHSVECSPHECCRRAMNITNE